MALVTVMVEVERVKMDVVCRTLGIAAKSPDNPEVLC